MRSRSVIYLTIKVLFLQALLKALAVHQLVGLLNVLAKQNPDGVTRPKKSLHFLLISPDSNLQFILNPKYCLLF